MFEPFDSKLLLRKMYSLLDPRGYNVPPTVLGRPIYKIPPLDKSCAYNASIFAEQNGSTVNSVAGHQRIEHRAVSYLGVRQIAIGGGGFEEHRSHTMTDVL